MPTDTDEALRQAFLTHRRAHDLKATLALIHEVAGVESLEEVPDDRRDELITALTQAASEKPKVTAFPEAHDVYQLWNSAGYRRAAEN